jgi:hypothetical protein
MLMQLKDAGNSPLPDCIPFFTAITRYVSLFELSLSRALRGRGCLELRLIGNFKGLLTLTQFECFILSTVSLSLQLLIVRYDSVTSHG